MAPGVAVPARSGVKSIAAAELTVTVFAIVSEIVPLFVDVAVKRWEVSTGKKAVLDGSDKTFDEVASERGVPLEAKQ